MATQTDFRGIKAVQMHGGEERVSILFEVCLCHLWQRQCEDEEREKVKREERA